MEIKEENVLAAYEKAKESGDEKTMKVLEELFGKKTFEPKDVTERIKTFEDACRELGEKHSFIQAYRQLLEIATREDYMRETFGADMVSYMKLRIICAALNEGWEPKFTKDECRYYPWFWLYTQDEINVMDEQGKQDQHFISTGNYETEYASFVCAGSYNAPSNACANFGSRLCLKSRMLANYCAKQFIWLWADFNLVSR